MSENEKTVTLKIFADAKKFQEELKNSLEGISKLETQAAKMRKSDIKGTTAAAKIADKLAKTEKKTKGKQALRQEQQLQRAINKTVEGLKKKSVATEKNAAAIKKELRALDMLSTKLQKIQKQRKDAGQLTVGERVGGALRTGGRGMRRGLRGIGRGVGLGLAAGAGGLLSLFSTHAQEGYQQYIQYGKAAGSLRGQGFDVKDLVEARKLGASRGFGPMDVVQQAMATSRQTGRLSDTKQAQMFGLAAGNMPTEQMAQFMGTLERSGTRGFGSGQGGYKQLDKILKEAVASGMDASRWATEFFPTVKNLTEATASQLPGRVKASGVADFLSTLTRSAFGGSAVRAGGAAAQLHAGVKSPGGGRQGQAFVLRALGYGLPGGQTSYVDALRMQDQGIFGAEDPMKRFRKILGRTSVEQGGNRDAMTLQLARTMNIGENLATKLVDLYQGRGLSDEAKQRELKKLEKDFKTPEQRMADSLENLTGFGKDLQHLADIQENNVTNGEKLAEHMQKLQKVISDFVVKHMDKVVAGIEMLIVAIDKLVRTLEDVKGGFDILTGQRGNLLEKTREGTIGKVRDRLSAMEKIGASPDARRAILANSEKALQRIVSNEDNPLPFGIGDSPQPEAEALLRDIQGRKAAIQKEEMRRAKAISGFSEDQLSKLRESSPTGQISALPESQFDALVKALKENAEKVSGTMDTSVRTVSNVAQVGRSIVVQGQQSGENN